MEKEMDKILKYILVHPDFGMLLVIGIFIFLWLWVELVDWMDWVFINPRKYSKFKTAEDYYDERNFSSKPTFEWKGFRIKEDNKIINL